MLTSRMPSPWAIPRRDSSEWRQGATSSDVLPSGWASKLACRHETLLYRSVQVAAVQILEEDTSLDN
jgi:hypothetical protein